MKIRPPGLDQNLWLMRHHQILPNDAREQDHLDMLRHVFRLTLGGALCGTRLDNPQKILDVGTGTGILAIES